MLSGSNTWEYLEVLIDNRNVLYSYDDTLVTLENLGFNRWELSAIMPNPIIKHVREDLESPSLYFAHRRPTTDDRSMHHPRQFHVAIFKRTKWIENE